MDRGREIVNLLAAVKRQGYSDGNAASVLASLASEKPKDRGFSDETLVYAHLSLFSSDPKHLEPAMRLSILARQKKMLDNILQISNNYRFYDKRQPPRVAERVEERFREHCARHGIKILRQLQAHVDGPEASRAVFLALDNDGLVKVFKEIREPEASPLGLVDDESEIYRRLGPTCGIPICYGTNVVDNDLRFLRMSVCYGRTLDEIAPLPQEEADYVIGYLAATLAGLHARGVVYNDLRLSNVKVDSDKVYLLDVGDAQFLHDNEVTTYVHGPRHAPPEVVVYHKAQPASDVFQLGVIYHELLFGRHPFSENLPHEEDPTLSRLRDCLANVLQPSTVENALMASMLDADPAKRPTAAAVAKTLTGRAPKVRTRPPMPESNGTVLFPARIGIPHRGHIDFIARLLELGYDLWISLGASYVRTSLDPLPKWAVMKMIGKSLELRGFDMKRVQFACTPLFTDEERVGSYYALMPNAKRVVAVASGNADVHRLFRDRWPIIDQRALFAREDEIYETRSWGAKLREAVRTGDRLAFDDLIAPGAESILSMNEMRACCEQTEIDFAWGDIGRPIVVLRNPAGDVVAKTRISAYSTPEDALVQALGWSFVDRFERNSVVKVKKNETATLVFEEAALVGKNIEINYRLEK